MRNITYHTTNSTFPQPSVDLAMQLPLKKVYFADWLAFTSIFGRIFTVHVQKTAISKLLVKIQTLPSDSVIPIC